MNKAQGSCSIAPWLWACLLLGLLSSARTAHADRTILSLSRAPGTLFELDKFTLTSRGVTARTNCDPDVPSPQVQVREAVSSARAERCVAGVGDEVVYSGYVCFDELCFERIHSNVTCCAKQNQIGLGFDGLGFSVCKAAADGWRTQLNVFSEVESEERVRPIPNVIQDVLFGIDNNVVTSTDPMEVALHLEFSVVSDSVHSGLKKAFDRYCTSNNGTCKGTRSEEHERNLTSFGCFSPPGPEIESYRSWLEQNFPRLDIAFQKGTRKYSWCVSPWSYFVPVGKNVFCVGIVPSDQGMPVLGSNLFEGTRIGFSRSLGITVDSKESGCVIQSQVCSGSDYVTTKAPSFRTESPAIDTTSDNAGDKSNSGLIEVATNAPVRTMAPTRRVTDRPVTLRPTSGTRPDETQDVISPKKEDEVANPPASVDDMGLSPLVWFGIGSLLTFILNCALLIYCRCRQGWGRSTTKFSRLPSDIEMTQQAPIPQTIQSVMPSGTTNGAPVSFPPSSRPALDSIIKEAAAPFEPNPSLAGGAAAFEKSWNQGLIVDVWGITLKIWQGSSLVDALIRLRLLRVASGTVSGVEKMYWIAKLKGNGSSDAILGMIEISVDLTTKRLSAVFKMTRSSSPGSPRDSNELHNLFEAFKRVVEETMC